MPHSKAPVWFVALLTLCATATAAEPVPDYSKDVAPILRKYCTGCHNAEDKEGGLSLETFAELSRGGGRGPAITGGSPDSSRLVATLTGQAEPQMPPEGMDAPTEDEVAMLTAWVKAGAKGPDGAEPDRTTLIVPQLKPADGIDPAITAVAWSPDGKRIAAGRFRTIAILDPATPTQKTVRTLTGLPGKVNSLEFSADGKTLLAASGVAGLYGQAVLFDTSDWSVRRTFQEHRDTLYAATLSPDGKTLATAGYDHDIILWDAETGKPLRTLDGHNGAVYSLAFSPDGTLLASASGDETGKVWHPERGVRMDTLSQPQAEQYAVAFRPDGRHVLTAGADNRIRVWQVVSRDRQRINPLLHARFAHDGAIVALEFSPDGRRLLTASEDRVVKVWETGGYTELFAWEDQPDVAQALCFAPDGRRFAVGRMDGSLELVALPESTGSDKPVELVEPRLVTSDEPMESMIEAEPNDTPLAATPIELPGAVAGVIHGTGDAADVDLYRFRAKAGEQWIIETNAARSKSPLDSKVEVLDAEGERILRVLLQAQRDSYFTFRGKDSDISDDFRVHNWQEMELDEYLYANGEVVRLWLYPRGPDSGFKVYPGRGKRYTYFGTPALSHALGEPCYIVRPLPPSAEVVPNGLPVFPVYYENDDDGRRNLGADSKLTFTAPADGEYLVRVSDVRGFGGKDFKYTLHVRPRRPDFRVKLIGANPTVGRGSATEFRVEAERLDEFRGPIRVDITGLPPGLHVTTPLVIEPDQELAYGVVYADADAEITPAIAESSRGKTPKPPGISVTATAEINGRGVTHPVNSLGAVEVGPKPQLLVRVLPADGPGPSGDPFASSDPRRPLELTVRPGETITARVQVERNGFKGGVAFGGDDSGRNLPHGAYVDNIGLNGLLVVPGKSERTIFITAAPITAETTRTFHLNTGAAGGQASWPVILHVRHGAE